MPRRLLTGLAALVLLAIVAAGCGGTRKQAGGAAVGSAEIATSRPGSVGVQKERVEGGVVHGEPVLRPGEEGTAVGLADRQAGCTGTDLLPSAENTRDVLAATLCLLNAERAARNLTPLRANAVLASVARGHARDMVARSYFAHDAPPPAHSSFVDRIRAAGYLRGAPGWTIGENLAWAEGDLASPSEIVAAWMASPEHRANILTRGYRETGLAVVLGVPQPSETGGATYGDEFGARLVR